MSQPFALPSRLPSSLDRVRDYWKGLLRGSAHTPFWDDVQLTAIPELADHLLLIDAFANPQRFRFGTIGEGLGLSALAGRFLDELEPPRLCEFLAAQCNATVECAAPTFYRREPGPGAPPSSGYARLLLPLWGDGRIGMLLGAIDFN
jgi:hypothetical protein